jgi:hypothetical protein
LTLRVDRSVPWLLGFFFTVSLCAQVSPGPLSKSHESLDTPLKCGSCHVFGAGTPKLHCLSCHREIQDLVARKRGYHGRQVKAKAGDLDCARCHTEHYGKNFSIVKWPDSRDTFDHRDAGYPLTGRHAGLKCEQCHNARHIPAAARARIAVKNFDRTYEGLSTACLTCHEDRHAGQLGADCQRCHTVARWKPLESFDHSATRYPLTGAHHDLACAKCHKPMSDGKTIQYTKLSFGECTGCHQDPHHGAFAARCESCHGTASWKRVEITGTSFDHGKTKFPLNGKHAGVACQKCHKDANFKTAVAHDRCLDCHQDQHRGQFRARADSGDCAACHNDKGWRPTTFTVSDHRQTAYPLAGKHAAVACAKCHPPAGLATNYHPAFRACLDCHRDPHSAQFADSPWHNRCEECHTVDSFEPSTFSLARHQATKFSLRGAHTAIACVDCHRQQAGHPPGDRVFRFASLVCEECHQDPHGTVSPALLKIRAASGASGCEACHGLRTWKETKPFDHSATAFPLAGAHRLLACGDCHRPQPAQAGTRQLRFAGAPKDCNGCHADIHGGQFRAACETCHNPVRWDTASFDHEKTAFRLTGAHERVPCGLCHTERREVAGRSVILYTATPRTCAACHHQ